MIKPFSEKDVYKALVPSIFWMTSDIRSIYIMRLTMYLPSAQLCTELGLSWSVADFILEWRLIEVAQLSRPYW